MTRTGKASRAGRATIVDVAHAASVSRQTVSNAVNHPERVDPVTLERVRREIDRLGYRASSHAQLLRAQRAGGIGIELNALGPARHNDVLYPFLVELTIRSYDHGLHLVPFASASNRPMLEAYEDMVRRRLVDAFVLTDTHQGDPRPDWLAGQGIPYATFGRVWDTTEFTAWADVDGAAGVRAGITHLADRGYGPVGFLGWPAGSAVGDDRRRGWLEAAHAHGVLGDAVEEVSVQEMAPAIEAANRLLDRLTPGSAVACASDLLGLAVVFALGRRGLRPGADIGVVGFDGSELAHMNDLTTLGQPLGGIAKHLLHVLDDLIAGRPAPTRGVLIEPVLHPAASTTPATRSH